MQHPHIRGLNEWRPLARGGLAMVWQARQTSLDRLVAVKVYQRRLSDENRRRFLHEVAVVGSLSEHSGIVSIHDAGILPDGRPYLIMEFCPDGSLSQWLEPESRPSQERVRQVGVLIADALAAVHARGVLHRNVKPANILIDSSGNPRLADFGLPAVAGATGAATGSLNTTPGYAPPETLRMQPATESGDIFSLGATLYALLTGGPPSRVDAAGDQQHLMAVLSSALSSDPAARPTATEFRDQLADLAEAGTADPALLGAADEPQAPVAAVYEPPTQRPGRSRVAVLVVAAVLVTVIGSAMAWLITEPVSSGVPAATSPTPTTPSPPLPPSASPPEASDPPVSTATQGGKDNGSGPAKRISLERPAASAKPFETVRISGTFPGGPDRFLRVQRREGGKWLSFPVPTKTDRSGRFTTYVELGKPGRYRLRVVDPDSVARSEPFVLVIKG